jgi:hypothetical protein
MENFNKIPEALIDEIKSGNCIAFVGAGFSAPALPTWDNLIRTISNHSLVSPKTRKTVNSLLDSSDNPATELFDKEAAAQILEDELSGELASIVREVLKPSKGDGDTTVRNRRNLLAKIPFQAILTTNFDDYLQAPSVRENAYSEVLKQSSRRWVDSVNWKSSEGNSLVPIVKLHGQLSDGQSITDVALSRSGYRKLLFERPDYANFLKAIFVTRTVLFIGFSFSDSYLNLLRSEVINLARVNDSDRSMAYAIMNDITVEGCKYLAKHEGIQPIRYSTTGTDGTPDHSGFDDLLDDIYNATNPETSVSEILAGKNILWLDPHPQNNTYAMQVISEVPGNGIVDTVSDLESALNKLSDSNSKYDLIITHWGDGLQLDSTGDKLSNAQALMRAIHDKNIEVPVLVFAFNSRVEEFRPKALAMGAYEYIWTFQDLFSNIEKIFATPATD